MHLKCKTTLDYGLEIKYLSSYPSKHVIMENILAAKRLADRAVSYAHAQFIMKLHGKAYSEIVDQVLLRLFRGASSEVHLKAICDRLLLTAQGFSRSLTLSDIAGRAGSEDEEGYVRPKPGYTKGKPDLQQGIHLAFDLASTYSTVALARIIIHEATHKFADTEDYGYLWQPRFKSMTFDQACDNADSYAYAALTILRGSIVTYMSLLQAGEHHDRPGSQRMGLLEDYSEPVEPARDIDVNFNWGDTSWLF